MLVTDVKENFQALLKEPAFWAVLTVVVALPIVALLASTFGLTGNAIQNIAFVKAGSEMQLEIKGVEGMQYVNTFFNADTKGGQIVFVEDSYISFSGTSYSKIKVSSDRAENIERMDYTFKLDDKRLKKLGLYHQDLKLFVNGNELPWTFDKEKDGYFYYTVSTKEMGDFVIGRHVPETAVAEPEEPVQETLKEQFPAEQAPADQALVGELVPTTEDIVEEPAASLAGEAIATQQPSVWEQYKTALLALIGILVIGMIIILVIRRVHPKKGLLFDHDHLRAWIEEEYKAGTKARDIRKILKKHTGYSRWEIDDAFPTLRIMK